jgi:HAD superfamily phosphatase
MPGPVLVFDMDGVLVDVTESYRETIRQTVKRFTGTEISHEAIQNLKNQGGWTNDWDVTAQLIQDSGVRARYEDVVAEFQALFLGDGDGGLMRRERWIARPGMLERLSGAYRLAVFTGRPNAEARMTLERFAPFLLCERLFGQDHGVRGKPAPDGLHKIAAMTGAPRLYYVGDTIDDARSARAAGVPFYGIAAASSPRREELVGLLRNEGAIAVLEDINQLEGLL